MGGGNYIVFVVVIILLFSSRQGTCNNICLMDYTKALQEVQGYTRSSNHNTCGKYEISDSTVKSDIHCLEACYRRGECKSIYYNRKDSYCILYRNSNDMLSHRCLTTSNHPDPFHAFIDRLTFQRMLREGCKKATRA